LKLDSPANLDIFDTQQRELLNQHN